LRSFLHFPVRQSSCSKPKYFPSILPQNFSVISIIIVTSYKVLATAGEMRPLAIRFENLIRTAQIADQADVARLGRVSRPRVTQIMNLLHLAPDIQEAILHLPRTTRGRDPIQERHVRPICANLDWRKQRRMWADVLGAS